MLAGRLEDWVISIFQMLSGPDNTLRLPYWNRIWVIQEIAVAKNLVFIHGCNMIHYVNLIAWLEPLYYTSQLQEASWMLYIIKTIRSKYQRGTSISLVDALRWSKHRLATDPRDKIYGILGLVDSGSGMEIETDYTKPLCAIYCKAICAMIDEWHSIALGLPWMNRVIDNSFTGELPPSESKKARMHCTDAIRLRRGLYPTGASAPSISGNKVVCDGKICGLKRAIEQAAILLQSYSSVL
jgi:hypothetical protein